MGKEIETLRQQVMEREQHIHVILVRERGISDFLIQQDKTGEIKDKQRLSTAPTEGSTVVEATPESKTISSLTSATTSWRADMRNMV